MQGNFFNREQQAEDIRRVQNLEQALRSATGPIPLALAKAFSIQTVERPARRYRRQGLTFVHLPASKPGRHGICSVCSKRTFLGQVTGMCRRCFLGGEGDDLAVVW